MTREEKLSLIAAYAAAGDQAKSWAALPGKLLDFRPRSDAWTIREHLVHLLDADLNGISRARKAIAEPGSPIYTYEEELWTARLGYSGVDLSLVVATFANLREIMAQTLKGLVDQDWTQYWYNHPVNGRVDLEAFVKGYIDHVEFHRAYVEKLKDQGK